MPGLRIAVANQKGGTGKTTLALNLAAGLRRRASTLVLDADPQASISQWAAMSGESGHLPDIQVVAQDGVCARIAQGTRGYCYVVIDCPPTLRTAMVGDVLNNVDVLLVPIQPSPVDLWASMDITAAVRNARQRNPQLKAFAVLNQLDSRNALSRLMHEALAELEFPTLRAGLARRAAYRNAAVEGTSVYGLGHRGKAAAHEVEALIEELLQS
jgi:chromosome partitioning protein